MPFIEQYQYFLILTLRWARPVTRLPPMNLRVPSIRHDDCDELAALCKAGGDPLRLNVLRALANDSFGVLELAQIFGIGQSGLSALEVRTSSAHGAVFGADAPPESDLGRLRAER